MKQDGDLQAWVEDGQGFVSGLPLHLNIKHSLGYEIASVFGLYKKDGYYLVEYAKTDGTKEKRSLRTWFDKDDGWIIVIGPPILLTEATADVKLGAHTNA